MGGISPILQAFKYLLFDCIDFFQDLDVPKPQYAKPLRIQPCAPIRIVSNLLGMLPAIQFDNQPLFKTYKIDNVLTDGLLSAELVPSCLAETNMLP
jgi:hypothetical protein